MRFVSVNPLDPEPALVAEAAALLLAGRLVVFPTETVYGLAASARDEAAVGRVFDAKDRPRDEPLPVQVNSVEAIRSITCDVPGWAWELMRAFMPGPLTVVLHVAGDLPGIVTAGGDTVAVRVPDQPVAAAILRAVAVPLVVTSANRHGRPAPTSAAAAREQLEGRVELVLDGGPCRVGRESTVVDLTVDPPRVVRAGALEPGRILALRRSGSGGW